MPEGGTDAEISITREMTTVLGATIHPDGMTIEDQTAMAAVIEGIMTLAAAAATVLDHLATGDPIKTRTDEEAQVLMAIHDMARSLTCLEGMALTSQTSKLFCNKKSTGTSWPGLRMPSRRKV